MNRNIDPEAMRAVVAQFDVRGRMLDARAWGSGHIHDTFRVVLEHGGPPRPYILQRMNTRVFPDADRLMENICRVTAHLRARLARMPGRDPDRETLTVVPTRGGRPYLRAGNGDCWRCYLFIANARTVDVIERPRQAREAARAFGEFQKLLADLPGPPLHEILPHFHDTPRRIAALEQAIAADACGRAKDCGPEIAFAGELKPQAGIVVDRLARGELPRRVTHNDTKINNVMLDEADDRAVCVIDLDIVMPGSVLFDFGDEVRSGVGRFQENDADLSRVGVDLEIFEQLAAGYLESAGGFLTDAELDGLASCGALITGTIGIRFLTDYLQGDVYFQTHRPRENLDRCRTQFALVRSIRRHEAAMAAIVKRCAKRS